MKPTKCINDHWYDGDKYDSCPHCAANRAGISNPSDVPYEKIAAQKPTANSVTRDTFGKADKWDSPFTQTLKEPMQDENDKIECIVPDLDIHMPFSKRGQSDRPAEPSNIICSTELEKEQGQAAATPLQSRQEAASDVTETVPFEEDKKAAVYGIADSELVVGWLVCIKGEYKGRSFVLTAGRNTIGRSIKRNISLTKELSVSREEYVIITFDPKNRKFYAQPGDSNGLAYINDEVLLEPCELAALDKIQIGTAEFLLKPLCDDQFAWEEYI